MAWGLRAFFSFHLSCVPFLPPHSPTKYMHLRTHWPSCIARTQCASAVWWVQRKYSISWRYLPQPGVQHQNVSRSIFDENNDTDDRLTSQCLGVNLPLHRTHGIFSANAVTSQIASCHHKLHRNEVVPLRCRLQQRPAAFSTAFAGERATSDHSVHFHRIPENPVKIPSAQRRPPHCHDSLQRVKRPMPPRCPGPGTHSTTAPHFRGSSLHVTPARHLLQIYPASIHQTAKTATSVRSRRRSRHSCRSRASS